MCLLHGTEAAPKTAETIQCFHSQKLRLDMIINEGGRYSGGPARSLSHVKRNMRSYGYGNFAGVVVWPQFIQGSCPTDELL